MQIVLFDNLLCPVLMPLQKYGDKKLIVEPAAKRVINYVTRSDIPCNVRGCAKCAAISGYREVFDPNELLLLPSLGVLLHYRHILQFVSAKYMVYLISVMNLLKSTDALYYNNIVKASGDKTYLFHDYVNSDTKLPVYDENAALQIVYKYYLQHGARPVLLLEREELHGDDFASIVADSFFTEYTYTFLGLQMPLGDFLNCAEAELLTGYMPHLPPGQLPSLAENGAVLTAQFKAGRGGFSGFAMHDKFGRVEFPGKYFVNRALNLDIVYFRLLTTNLEKDDIVQEAHLFPLVQGAYEKVELAKLYGIVVGIKARRLSRFCGTLEKMFGYSVENAEFKIKVTDATDFFAATVVPVSENLPKFFIRSATTLGPYCGYRCEFQLQDWDCSSRIPSCVLCESIGPVADRNVESEVILRERGVRHFDLEAVQTILDELPRQILDYVDYHRLDLSAEVVCSVDPVGCKDIDDALHCTLLSHRALEKRWGRYLLDYKNYGRISKESIDSVYAAADEGKLQEIGVHIADVSHYVKKGSQIDIEAAYRCTSVYLQDRRIDMLPKLLTEQVCSLVADGRRFCFSCLILIHADTRERLVYRFVKTIIQNHANLSYQEAYLLVERGVDVDISERFNSLELKAQLVTSLRELLAISRHLRKCRIDAGALLLDSPEASYKLDEHGMPIGLDEHAHLPTMSMVEEFMLLANYCAAETMLAHFPGESLLRRHPVSAPELFEDLKRKLVRFGLEIDTSSKDTISSSIRRLSDYLQDYPALLDTVRLLLTRCMSLAKYFPSGNATEPEFLHFGLALKYYTHFTSPIRRYSDILVHRILGACIGVDRAIYTLDELTTQCTLLNERKEYADRASRDSARIFGVLFLLKCNVERAGEHFENASVIAIQPTRIFMIVPGMEAELDVQVKGTISDDGLQITLDTGRTIAMFERIRVRVFYDFEKPYRFRFKAEIV